ncbi:L-2-amino-thiazoline-4-carboxylic acid hydrolase [Megalodesulfovibrio paquesii]
MQHADCVPSRRRFLRAGLIGCCGLLLPQWILPPRAMAQTGPPAALPSRRVAEFEAMCQGMEQMLTPRLGAAAAHDATTHMGVVFQELLPTLPVLPPQPGEGGAPNRNQEYLVQAAWLIAMSKGIKAHGLCAADAGRLLYDLCDAELAATPAVVLAQRGEEYFSPAHYQALRDWAAATQLRRSPDDWVAEVVFGDPARGDDFDVGHNYSQCGALLLFRAHGEAEVAPYFCLNDFLSSRYEGTGLSRAHTLAQGDALCDFRYKRGREVGQSWDTETPRFTHTESPSSRAGGIQSPV